MKLIIIFSFLLINTALAQLDLKHVKDLRCHVTRVNEFKKIFPSSIRTEDKRDGGGNYKTFWYSNGHAFFSKYNFEKNTVFTLKRLVVDNKRINIGCDKIIVLRDEKDLATVTRFDGVSNMSLNNLDLTNRKEWLISIPFTSQTVWPYKLPKGFTPQKILETGKNPGLGVRSLHKEGINGSDVAIAIIDQPLLTEHIEYKDQLVHYDDSSAKGIPVQMHGPPVASIAVGKSLGVAPKAKLYYFTRPMGKKDNRYYAQTIDKIIEINKKAKPRIRVISISFGGFHNAKNHPLWKKAIRRAKNNGIFVSTCGATGLNYYNLELDFNLNPDNPKSYRPSSWVKDKSKVLYIPGGNRTIASYHGTTVYKSERGGGLSWSAPYIAGVAALAFQVNSKLTHDQVNKIITTTATPVSFGTIINPRGIINKAKSLN